MQWNRDLKLVKEKVDLKQNKAFSKVTIKNNHKAYKKLMFKKQPLRQFLKNYLRKLIFQNSVLNFDYKIKET